VTYLIIFDTQNPEETWHWKKY